MLKKIIGANELQITCPCHGSTFHVTKREIDKMDTRLA